MNTDQLVRMSEGIIGALMVLKRLVDEHPRGQEVVDKLDSLKIYGSDIWLGYKDHYKQNLNDFASGVLEENAGMLEMIRQNRG